MTMSILVFLIILIVLGAGLFLITDNKWSKLGIVLYGVALLWLIYYIQGKGLHL